MKCCHTLKQPDIGYMQSLHLYTFIRWLIWLKHPDVHQKFVEGYHVVRRIGGDCSQTSLLNRWWWEVIRRTGPDARKGHDRESTLNLGHEDACLCKTQRCHAEVQWCILWNQRTAQRYVEGQTGERFQWQTRLDQPSLRQRSLHRECFKSSYCGRLTKRWHFDQDQLWRSKENP